MHTVNYQQTRSWPWQLELWHGVADVCIMYLYLVIWCNQNSIGSIIYVENDYITIISSSSSPFSMSNPSSLKITCNKCEPHKPETLKLCIYRFSQHMTVFRGVSIFEKTTFSCIEAALLLCTLQSNIMVRKEVSSSYIQIWRQSQNRA